jgi:hypothetical protein
LTSNIPFQVNFPKVIFKLQKLVDMLADHAIVMSSGTQIILGMLKNADDNNRPQVAIAESPEPMDYASPNFLRFPVGQDPL